MKSLVKWGISNILGESEHSELFEGSDDSVANKVNATGKESHLDYSSHDSTFSCFRTGDLLNFECDHC